MENFGAEEGCFQGWERGEGAECFFFGGGGF